MLGALGRLESIWAGSDTLNGLMAVPNLIAIVVLSGVVIRLMHGFLRNEPYTPPDAEQGRQSANGLTS